MKGVQLLAVVGSLGLLLIVLDLIRRRRVKEELWIPWALLAAGSLVASLWKAPWETLATTLGIEYEPSLIFLVGIFVCLGLLLHLTLVVSSLLANGQRLAQTVARLQAELERVSSPTTPPSPAASTR